MFGFSIGNRATHNKSKTNGMAKGASGRGTEGATPEPTTNLLNLDKLESGLDRSDRHAAELKAIKKKMALWGAGFGAAPIVGPAMTGVFLSGVGRADGGTLTKLGRIGACIALGAAGVGLSALVAAAGPGAYLAGLAVSGLVGAYAVTRGVEAQYKHFGEKRDDLVKSADFVESMEFPSINMHCDTRINLKTGNTFSINAYGAYMNGRVVSRCTREWSEDGIHLGSGTDEHTISTDGSSHVTWTSKEKSYQVDRDVNGEWGPVMMKGSEENSEWEVSNLKLRHDKKRLVVGTGESLGDIMEVDLMVDPRDVVGH